ncbi:hypothetical protein WAI453_001946 [Rhynchosporium graminicola]
MNYLNVPSFCTHGLTNQAYWKQLDVSLRQWTVGLALDSAWSFTEHGKSTYTVNGHWRRPFYTIERYHTILTVLLANDGMKNRLSRILPRTCSLHPLPFILMIDRSGCSHQTIKEHYLNRAIF